MWCAFPFGESQEAAPKAQHVLENLSAASTLNLTQIGPGGAALLRRCADSLGIKDVNSCERLAEAIKESGSSLCTNSDKDSIRAPNGVNAARRFFQLTEKGSTQVLAGPEIGHHEKIGLQ